MPADGRRDLTLILPTWRIWWAPNDDREWRMGFNSAFKGLAVLLDVSANMNCGLVTQLPGASQG